MKNSFLCQPLVLSSTSQRGLQANIICGMYVMVGFIFAARVQAENVTTSPNLLGEKTEITVGAGAIVMPRYVGSSETRTMPFPVISVQRGVLFADMLRGLGAEYETESGFYISSSLGYDEGRTMKNSSWRTGSKRLAGMGEIKGSTTFNLATAQQLTSWLSVTAAGEFALDGQKNRGNQYRLGVNADVYDTESDNVTLDLNAHAGDRDYNLTYFGVTNAQSQTSNFSRFDSGSGIYGYSLTGSWTHSFDDHWSVITAINTMCLTDDAAHSPLVQEKTSVTGLVTLNYSFRN